MRKHFIGEPGLLLFKIIFDFRVPIFDFCLMTASDNNIQIRTDMRPGDIGYITFMHGNLYSREYGYGIAFESYVAAGLHEFYTHYDPAKDRIWLAESGGKIIASMLLMHRPGNAAQLRYFLIDTAFRGAGLGKKLMQLYMDFYKQCGYTSSYLLTTSELDAAASLYKRYGFQLTEEKESSAFGKVVSEQRYDLNNKANP
jgi:GNAT superfamily N-acetyltransferase